MSTSSKLVRKYPFSFIFLLLFTFLHACIAPAPKENEIYSSPFFLQYKNVWLGVLPKVGGSLVFLSDSTRVNVLSSDSTLWVQHKQDMPSMGTRYSPRPYNGHTVWLGPQEDWWTKQDVDPSLKRKGAPWPPDPYLTFGEYTMLPATDSSIRMRSPVSPFTGIQLTKEIIITGKNTVLFRATAKNMRSSEVRWDIWMNTRLEGHSMVYIPASGITNIQRIDQKNTGENQGILYTISDGYFNYFPSFPAATRMRRSSKAYLIPDSPFMAAFTKKHLLIERFDSCPSDQVPPGQAPVEIFNCVSTNPEETILEMESHGPYSTLAPGDSMTRTITWQIHPYSGKKDRKEEIKFLQSILLKQ